MINFQNGLSLLIIAGITLFIASALSVLYPPLCVYFFYAGLISAGTGVLVILIDLIL